VEVGILLAKKKQFGLSSTRDKYYNIKNGGDAWTINAWNIFLQIKVTFCVDS
jgi:hypothetical protein